MKALSLELDQSRAEKLKALSEATTGNMTNVTVGGEFIEYEHKLSASKLAKALLNSAIDRAYSQLPK